MALYWNTTNLCWESMPETDGAQRTELTLMQSKDTIYHTLPDCEPHYLKHIDGIPTEMSAEEKTSKDVTMLADAKAAKIAALTAEMNHRIENFCSHEEDHGIHLAMPTPTQINKIAQAVVLIKNAINLHFSIDIIAALPQEQQDIYTALENNDWGGVLQLEAIEDDIIANEIETATTLEEVAAVKIPYNTKWLV